MKKFSPYFILLILLMASSPYCYSQKQKIKNQPYADQKLFHLGFSVGLNAQDVIISHTGHKNTDNSVWFSEIPYYSFGLSVGLIADRYLNQYMNLRAIPTIHFTEKEFVFKEQNATDDSNNYSFPTKNTYLSLPVHMRFSSERLNNIRPYVLLGGYISTEIGRKDQPEIKLKNTDYGIDIGLGCNLYFPLFRLSPELRFSFGLRDLIQHDRSDLQDESLIKFTDAIKSGKTRMITLTFNFE